MRHLKTALTVLGALTILLLAGNTVAYAATGKALLLGKTNYSEAQTNVVRTTNGPALRLKTKSPANAPLSVNGTGKVANLNADRLDGLDSSTLRTHSRIYTTSFTKANRVTVTLPLSNGSYLIDYAVYAEVEANEPVGLGCHLMQNHTDWTQVRRVGSDMTEVSTEHLEYAVSGSGLVTKSAGATIQLFCEAYDGEMRTDGIPVQIVVTPTSRLASQNLTAKVTAAQAP